MGNRNNDGAFWFAVIALVAVVISLYLFVKKVGMSIGLPPGPTAWLLVGVTSFFGGLLYAWLSGRRVHLWVWWLATGAFLFFTPALNYWSLDTVSRMMVDSDWHRGELEHAWYGSKWAQAGMVTVLLGIAAFVYHNDSD
ncbi:hypothetical protein CSQ96_29055 [Janthinobacterium sp. BJB412]|nr:hypothetical protein CSQ96_29055 [Janthinobacterium sp. BJB412]